jgi:hypothetical protein
VIVSRNTILIGHINDEISEEAVREKNYNIKRAPRVHLMVSIKLGSGSEYIEDGGWKILTWTHGRTLTFHK